MNDEVIQSREQLPDGVCVVLGGDIDLSRSPELRAGLLELVKSRPARLIIDLAAVPYMDSSGVATLVEALQQQRRHQGRLLLSGLQPKVRSIFEIARLNMVFTIVDTAATAKSA